MWEESETDDGSTTGVGCHRGSCDRRIIGAFFSKVLLARLPSPSLPASLLARLLVVRMLLQLAQDAALLQLHIEALEGAVDALVRLDDHVDQMLDSSEVSILADSRRS